MLATVNNISSTIRDIVVILVLFASAVSWKAVIASFEIVAQSGISSVNGMHTDFWEKVLLNYGPMWAMIFFTSFCMWRVGKYLSPRLSTMVDAHVSLVNTLSIEVPKQTRAWEDTARAAETTALLLEKHSNDQKIISESLSEVKQHLAKIRKDLG